MKRAVLAVAVAVGLVIGVGLPISAIGLTQVTINCSDGTSATVIVDANALTSLTESVQAMIDFPAGLDCTLLQSPVPLAFGAIALASPGSNPFIVAGGRWQVPCSAIGLGRPGGAIPGGAIARVAGLRTRCSRGRLRRSTKTLSRVTFMGPAGGEGRPARIITQVCIHLHQDLDPSRCPDEGCDAPSRSAAAPAQ